LYMLSCVCLLGCASNVQVGLANAPWLGGATIETRVHDAIANGRDSCERSAFPEGGVLRGQVPPCVTAEPIATVPDFRWLRPPGAGRSGAAPQLWTCLSPNPWSEPAGARIGLSAISLSLPRAAACN